MTARILVVENIAANRKLLEARLLSENYDVVCASSGADAIHICRRGHIDVVLLDTTMPDMDGYEVCRRLKSDARTCDIAVVMLTSSEQPEERIRGLEAGAGDFLLKPVSDVHLMSCMTRLVQLKLVTEGEGLADHAYKVTDEDMAALLTSKLSDGVYRGKNAAHILILDDNSASADQLRHTLEKMVHVDIAVDANTALIKAIETDYDSIIVSTSSYAAYDPLQVCAQLRAIERTRLIPVLLIVSENEGSLVVQALELGINDYLMRPVEKLELFERLRAQIKRKCHNDLLRLSLQRSIATRHTDNLTGLYNRRYLDIHMPVLYERAISRERPLTLIRVDFDHFKQLNMQFGYDAGDHILQKFGMKLRQNTRRTDMTCRYSGEEFIVVMPDTPMQGGMIVADRIHNFVAALDLPQIEGKKPIDISVSIGVTTLRPSEDSLDALLNRATEALGHAQKQGRHSTVIFED